ncbi:MAG TPA: hypothetical protein PK528_03210, partial [Syntrophorhabdus sp.]|nr:hypothetical protein [Syntrophorhabdus sp.]
MVIAKLFRHVILAFFALLLCFSAGNAFKKATVIKVVDGDTLKIEMNGQEEAVRLIGIDTPESRINKKAKKDSLRSNQDID